LKEKQRLRRQNQTAEQHQIAKTQDNSERICSRKHVKKLETAGKT
jgi:hypothetical protein